MDRCAPLHFLLSPLDASAVRGTGGVGGAVIESFKAEFFGDGELDLGEEALEFG